MRNDFKIIKKLEIELASKDTRRSKELLSELLAEDFEEIGKSGKIFSKSDVLASLPNQGYQEIQLSQFRFVKLVDNIVLVKYQSSVNCRKALRPSIITFPQLDRPVNGSLSNPRTRRPKSSRNSSSSTGGSTPKF